MTDPSPIVAILLPLIPAPYAIWAGDALTMAGILSMLASALSASVAPPAATAWRGWRIAYRVLTWPAINLGWARNAVPVGMHPAVREAALVSAKLAAAAPELTTVAEAPAIKGAIVPQAAPATFSKADVDALVIPDFLRHPAQPPTAAPTIPISGPGMPPV